LPHAPKLAQVLSCPRFGFVEAGKDIARDRLMARSLRTQLSIHQRLAL
jgi:hypothetical protein